MLSIDSAEVIHGMFKMEGITDSTSMASLYMDDESIMPFVIEKGKISISIDNARIVVTGTPLNDRLYDFVGKKTSLDDRAYELERQESRMIMDGKAPDEIQREITREREKLAAEMNALAKEFIQKNYDNVLGPGEFIPLAEYLGLITSIGDYVLEEACRRCKLWNDNGHPDFYINVNLSVVQLLQKDVVENIKRILDKTGVNPKNIVLEITESFAINDMQRVMDIITGLKKLGPRIALDDFGTGYSSLNYIKQLPLDIIKVDKTFIDDIVEDDYAQAFIKLIVDLSKTIGTKIVVEGVEHKEQFELLKSLGVDYIQGYYFGKPVPANIFEEKNLEGRLGE